MGALALLSVHGLGLGLLTALGFGLALGLLSAPAPLRQGKDRLQLSRIPSLRSIGKDPPSSSASTGSPAGRQPG